MTWIDRSENNQFSIKTGDGKVFFPLWRSGGKSREYNNSIFEFIDVEGSKVDRKKARSAKYTLVFWFSGLDNIEQSEQFELSANDPRSWEVNHPFYGVLSGQPVSLERNDSNYNTTEITVEFWESINSKYPRKTVAPLDQAKQKTDDFRNQSSSAYASKVDPKPADQSTIRESTIVMSTRTDSLLDDINYSEYQLIKSQAFQSIDELITDPASCIQDINKLLLEPSEFQKSIQQRLDYLKELYQDALDVLNVSTPSNKSYFEAIAGAIISSICLAVLTPIEGDYISRSDVENVFSELIRLYEDYLLTLDSLQVNIEDVSNAFSPSYLGQFTLNSLVNETIFNLFEIAFESKQERIILLEKDTNVILLTHKYIGLDLEDKNIDLFREMNGIKNKSLFIIRKGRQIKYLV